MPGRPALTEYRPGREMPPVTKTHLRGGEGRSGETHRGTTEAHKSGVGGIRAWPENKGRLGWGDARLPGGRNSGGDCWVGLRQWGGTQQVAGASRQGCGERGCAAPGQAAAGAGGAGKGTGAREGGSRSCGRPPSPEGAHLLSSWWPGARAGTDAAGPQRPCPARSPGCLLPGFPSTPISLTLPQE